MENNTNNSSIFNFEFDEESKSNLSSIAQWTNINAIVGFIGIVVSVLSTAIALFKIKSYGGGTGAFASGIFTLLISLGLSLLLNITLIYAAINIKQGLQLSNQQHLVTGLSKLATYFKIFGILMIIVLVIVLLALLIGIFAGGLGRSF